MAAGDTTLQEIAPRRIDANKDNPRLIFREAEMNALLDSIREVGIKVPLSVYRQAGRFVLIDGERRWRCARKLNLKSVPAIVQPKPGRLENILTMFNIHNVRSDWDLMPTALKLDQVRKLLKAEGREPTGKDLAGLTGMSLPTVRRALELLELPKKYQQLLLAEAKKPREEQMIKVDLFIEINKAKGAIKRYVPEVFEDIDEEQFVEAMVKKYTSGLVPSVTSFREISKMARAERAGEDPEEVEPVLVELVRRTRMTINDAYEETVGSAYLTRDVTSRAASLSEKLHELRRGRRLAPELVEALEALRGEINRLLA
jgi:ParB family chromosome partitioning protein